MPRFEGGDSANKFMVSAFVMREELAILRPPLAAQMIPFDDAINLAAWLVALTPDGRARFDRAYRKVTSS